MQKFFAINDVEKIDIAKLIRQLPRARTNAGVANQMAYVKAILASYDILRQHNINTALRLAHFIGQGLIETGWLTAVEENLNYSAKRLHEIFPRYFRSEEEARSYAGNPERIANRVYANRMGNGPEASGDGWRYRGRGFFQLTGKDNYRRFGDMAGIDLVSDPDIIARDLQMSVRVAAAYFDKAGLGAFADANNGQAVSRGVNLGNPRVERAAHGEAERLDWTARALTLVRNPQSIAPPSLDDPQTAPSAPADPDTLAPGATGAKVQTLQRDLASLGYTEAAENGVFGPGTQRAVRAFQRSQGLAESGVTDAATRAALERALGPAPDPAPGAPPAPDPGKPPRPPLETKPADKPLAQSRTIWGAILAAIGGGIEFLRGQFAQVAALFPVVETPAGPFNTVWILAGLLLLGVILVIFARIDDRNKKRR